MFNSKKMTSVLVIVFLIAISCGLAFAQEVKEEDKVKDEKAAPTKDYLAFDVKDYPLKNVAEMIKKSIRTKIDIDVAPEVEKTKITIEKVANLHYKELLKLIADRYKELRLEEVRGNYFKFSKARLVSIKVDNAPIPEVIKTLAMMANANIIVSDKVSGKVSVSLKNVELEDAIKMICKTKKLELVKEKKDLWYVVPKSVLKEDLVVDIFQLLYIRPPSRIKPKLSSQYADVKTAASSNPVSDFTLLKALKQVKSKNGSLEYSEKTNTIIVKDTRTKIEEMRKIIQQLDVEPLQVMIDVKFITTSNTDFSDFGIDWGGANNQGPVISHSLGSMLSRLPFNLGNGGWEDNLSIRPRHGRIDGTDVEGPGPSSSDVTNTIAAQSPATAFTFGTLDFSGVQATLRIFKRDVQSKIVQAPKIVTLDNEDATIFVGRTIRYAQTTAESNEAGALEYGIAEADNSPVQTGFQLLVVPHIIRGKNKVMLTIIPMSESLVGTTSEITGFDEFTSGEQSIDLPQVETRTLVTKMILESGQTAVIGGLIQESNSVTINKIPLLGDIPILGYLFKNKSINKMKETLIIFITPRILRSSEEQRKILESRMRKRRKESKDELKNMIKDVEGKRQ